MPRRTAVKCGRRGCRREELDPLIELALCYGDAFGPWDLRARDDFARPWAAWGDEITARWIAAFPGSRPMAAYVLGDLEPWAWEHELPALRHPLPPIAGVEVVIDRGGHRREQEVDHLRRLGLLDRRELAAALERLAAPDPTYHGRYSPVAALVGA